MHRQLLGVRFCEPIIVRLPYLVYSWKKVVGPSLFRIADQAQSYHASKSPLLTHTPGALVSASPALGALEPPPAENPAAGGGCGGAVLDPRGMGRACLSWRFGRCSSSASTHTSSSSSFSSSSSRAPPQLRGPPPPPAVGTAACCHALDLDLA